MSILSLIKQSVAVAMLSSIAITAFADDAPVFDADNYPPQFDGQPDNGAPEAPMPPPPQAQAVQPAYVPSTSQSLTMEQRIVRVEQQMANAQHSDSSTKLGALQSEVQALRGQVEELTHQLQQMQNQQKSMYSDLDKRISKEQAITPSTTPPVISTDTLAVADIPKTPEVKVKSKPEKVVAPVPAPEPVAADTAPHTAAGDKVVQQPNVAEEQRIYQTAYDFIKVKKYDQAINALQGMLKKYPTGQFAANAHYWLGELYGLQGSNDRSAAEFANVVKNYPDSPKVSDAQLKLGLIYAAQFKWSDAKSAFKKVINHYPGSASSRLASEQLKQIKLAGH